MEVLTITLLTISHLTLGFICFIAGRKTVLLRNKKIAASIKAQFQGKRDLAAPESQTDQQPTS